MSPDLHSPPAGVGCSACPGNENASLGSKKPKPSYAHGSASVGRTLGRRSLDTFSSIRGSFKRRLALHPTTNQKTVAQTKSASASDSPIGPPAKSKRYESLRGKPSQIPTLSTPLSMPSTLKRSRFFRTLPAQLPTGELSSLAAPQTQVARDPLPRFHIASLQSELQRMSLFGDPTEKSIVVDAELKPESRSSTASKATRVQTKTCQATKPEPQAYMVTATPAAGSKLSLLRPAANAPEARDEKTTSTAAIVNVPAGKKSVEPCRVLCDLYYKGSPWHPEHKTSMPDATSALSQFALRHMLSEHRDCSNTLLWTNEIEMNQLKVKQTFTIYPLIDGPLRKEIQKNHDLHWAIITFTDGPSTTRSTDLREEDERLTMAIRYVTSMGYHVDVWTYLDDDEWDADLDMAEAEFARGLEKEGDKRSSSRNSRVFLDPQHLARHEKYESFVRRGVAGFLQADLDLFEKLRCEVVQLEQLGLRSIDNDFARIGVVQPNPIEPARLPQFQLQSFAGPELMGFLEHAEEIIAEVD